MERPGAGILDEKRRIEVLISFNFAYSLRPL
jgi:hypothetical protein